MTARRGTTNGNARGNSRDRKARKLWLLATYAADMVLYTKDGDSACVHVRNTEQRAALVEWGWDEHQLCRCYRCGDLLSFDTLTVDRINPGCDGGTYRRTNIRPACDECNSSTGGALAHQPRKRRP